MFEIKNKFANENYTNVTEEEFLMYFDKVTSKEALIELYTLIKDKLCKVALVHNNINIGFIAENYFIKIFHSNKKFSFDISNIDGKLKELLFKGVIGCTTNDDFPKNFLSIIRSWEYSVKHYEKEFKAYEFAFNRMVYNASNEGFILKYDNTLIRPRVFGFDTLHLHISVNGYTNELEFTIHDSFEVNEIYNSFAFKNTLFNSPEKLNNNYDLMLSLNKLDVNNYAKYIFHIYSNKASKSLGGLFYHNKTWNYQGYSYTLDELLKKMSVNEINNNINMMVDYLTYEQKKTFKNS